jgi:hypothetical protein
MAKAGRHLGLSSLVRAMKRACRAVELFGPIVRRIVPAAKLADYDAALAAVTAACLALRAFEYEDSEAGTTVPWGQ